MVTVSTNKSQYFPSEMVMVLGKVTDSQNNPLLGVGVSIQINDPTGAMVNIQLTYSDSNGAYSDQFTLPPNSAQGQYTVFVTATKAGFNPSQVQTKFSVGPQTSSSLSTSTASKSSTQTSISSTQTSTSSKPTPPSLCLIATATFGSELAPEVALLRNFRDAEILHTAAGSSFMLAFNAFYYSFSPQVAYYISSHDYVRPGMKVILYPLIGILYLTNRLFTVLSFNMELAVTISGVFAAFALGAVYLGPLVIIGLRALKKRPTPQLTRAVQWILLCCLISIVGIFLAELIHQDTVLLASTVATVLSSVAVGGCAIPHLIRTLQAKS